jgi:hypothetical protein
MTKLPVFRVNYFRQGNSTAVTLVDEARGFLHAAKNGNARKLGHLKWSARVGMQTELSPYEGLNIWKERITVESLAEVDSRKGRG